MNYGRLPLAATENTSGWMKICAATKEADWLIFYQICLKTQHKSQSLSFNYYLWYRIFLLNISEILLFIQTYALFGKMMYKFLCDAHYKIHIVCTYLWLWSVQFIQFLLCYSIQMHIRLNKMLYSLNVSKPVTIMHQHIFILQFIHVVYLFNCIRIFCIVPGHIVIFKSIKSYYTKLLAICISRIKGVSFSGLLYNSCCVLLHKILVFSSSGMWKSFYRRTKMCATDTIISTVLFS